MTYTPRIDLDIWAKIDQFVLAAVASCAGKTPYSDRELLIAASRLTAWSTSVAGNDLDVGIVFHRRTIGRFAATALDDLAPASRANYRARLLRMAEVLAPVPALSRLRPLQPSAPAKPYTERQVVQLRAWAAGQTAQSRIANARTLLALGLGAGLSAVEIGTVRASDLDVDRGVVVRVSGERRREVPVLHAWEEPLIERARQLPPGTFVFREKHTVFYPNLISNFVERSGPGLRPQTSRMRATWLVHHLQRGTPVPVLLDAAGVTSLEALTRYLKFVVAPDPDVARQLLRGP